MNTDRLLSGLSSLHIPCDDMALRRFQQFHDILDEYNRVMDLTAVLDEDERIDRHDLDSAVVFSCLEIPAGASVMDVGTGAGFPGIPMIILRPDIHLTLMDAQQKRCHFLQEALQRMELTAEVVHARAEDAGRDGHYREQYDFAVSRAVAAMGVLQELMLPFVKQGGKAIAWKGPKGTEELDSAALAATRLGGRFDGALAAEIPGRDDWQHMLLVTQKTGKTPSVYPRKAGVPSKKPLA